MSDDSARRGGGRRPMSKARKITLLVGVVVVVLLVWFVVRGVTAKVSPTTDYATELEQRTIAQIATADGVPPTPNQWDVIMRIADDLDASWKSVAKEFPTPPEGYGDRRWPGEVFDFNPFTASEGVRQRMREVVLLMEVRSALDRSALLATARGFRVLPKGQPLALAQLPDLTAVRGLARAMALQMQIAALDERWELSAQWYERTLGLGRIMTNQPTLIDRLVGIAIISLANDRLRTVLAHTLPDDAALRGFDAALVRQLGIDELGAMKRVPSAAYSIENERIALLDSVQWCFTDNGDGDGRLVAAQLERFLHPGAMPGGKFANLMGSFLPGRKATVDLATAAFAREAERSKVPVQQRAGMPTMDDFDRSRTQIFLSTMLPALSSATRSHDQLQLDVISMRLIFALERHRIRTGAYPAALRDLVPVEMSFIPADPFSTIGLVYRAEGSTYVLYSAGLDNTDDGGKVPAKEGERFHALGRDREGKGYDYMLGAPKKE